MNKALHKLKLNNVLVDLSILLKDIPKEMFAANAALWGSRSILQYSIDYMQKELKETHNALSSTSDS